MLLSINPKNPQPRLVQQVVELLENDGVIIYPTDTVYGLGCSIYSKKAMKRLHLIKKMDPKKPLTLICSNQTQIQEYTQGIETPIFKLLRKHLPGPYTFVFRASKIVPKMMLTPRSTVGFRWPDHPITLAIVEMLGHPILAVALEFQRTNCMMIPRKFIIISKKGWIRWWMEVPFLRSILRSLISAREIQFCSAREKETVVGWNRSCDRISLTR